MRCGYIESDYITMSHLQSACEQNDLKEAERLLKYVKPSGGVWRECCKNYRLAFIKLFVKNKFYPRRDVFLESYMLHSDFYDPFTIITKSLCRNAVYCVIGIGKRLGQPYSHLFVIIAKHLWEERNNVFCWGYALEWEEEEEVN